MKNKFDDNAKENDLKRILSLLNEDVAKNDLSLLDYVETEDGNL